MMGVFNSFPHIAGGIPDMAILHAIGARSATITRYTFGSLWVIGLISLIFSGRSVSRHF
jgi:hypothetical protein